MVAKKFKIILNTQGFALANDIDFWKESMKKRNRRIFPKTYF